MGGSVTIAIFVAVVLLVTLNAPLVKGARVPLFATSV